MGKRVIVMVYASSIHVDKKNALALAVWAGHKDKVLCTTNACPVHAFSCYTDRAPCLTDWLHAQRIFWSESISAI